MVDQTQLGLLSALVDQLNAALGEITPYKLAILDPARIQPVDDNAHYMPKRVYDQLQANIRQDGNLASLPFCWQRDDRVFVCLSGNHRVMAAADAGVKAILVLYTDQALSQAEQIAIQLSHNSLVGLDDPNKLRTLWSRIHEAHLKIYSGLDEGLLKTMDQPKLFHIASAPLRFERVELLFLPAEIERISAVLKALGSRQAALRLAVPIEAFDRFFEALLQAKTELNIINTSTAFLFMIDLAEAWLAENERDNTNEAETGQPTQNTPAA
jgi:hypothetical protein